MKILKRCIAAAVAAVVAGSQLFCPEFIDNDNIMVAYAFESRISENGIALIKEFEGYTQYAQWDYHQWSIGYGTGVDKDAYPNGITEPEADRLLRNVVLKFEEFVQNFLNRYNIRVTQNQYDALVSFTYNMGNVWSLSSEVTIREYLINGIENYTPQQIKDAFGLWVKAGGQVLPGLVRRRAREAELFLTDGEYLTDTAAGERWRITSSTGVRLRTGPGTSFNAVGAVPYNTVINVSEKKSSEGFLWGKISLGGYDGWCVLDYAEYISGKVDTEVVPDDYKKTEKWKITSSTGVNLRHDFATSSSVTDIIPFSTVIPVYEKKDNEGYTWGRTEYNGSPGWCVLDYAVKVDTDENGDPVVKGIRVSRKPDRTVYTAGDKFDSSGMKVVAVYSDGSEKEVHDYGCSGNMMLPGPCSIKIEYQGMKTEFEIKLEPHRGDINANGIIDTDDVYYLKSFILNSITGADTDSSGDINGDGVVDVIDSIYARRKILENYNKDS